jgi:hypothetical protein
MTDLTPSERAFLESALEDWGPSEDLRSNVRAALPLPVALGAEPGGDEPAEGPCRLDGAPPPNGPAAPAAPRGLWASGAAVVVIGLCVAGALWSRGQPAPVRDAAAPTAVPAPVPMPVPVVSPPLEPAVTVSVDSLPAAPVAPAAPRPVPSPSGAAAASGASDSLAQELLLLRAAQAALRAGTPDDALTSLATHATRFPEGKLREERMTLEVLAKCARGDVAGARVARAALERVAPGSSHLERLSSSCAAP